MKRVGEAIAWLLSRLVKVFGNILSLLVRPFVPVRKGRVMCWAYNFKQYGCNPRYLSEYLLDSGEEYEIFWVYRKEKYGSRMDSRMKSVKFRSWMATHSSVLAWRIPGTGEPGGLQSLGSHRVGHD